MPTKREDDKIEEFNKSFEDTFVRIPETHRRILKDSADQLGGFQKDYLSHVSLNFGDINSESRFLVDNTKNTPAGVRHCNSVFDGSFTPNLDQAGLHLKDFSDLA